MALFKILRGSKDNLINKRVDSTKYIHDGYCYFTPEDGKFYIDVATNPSSSIEEPVIGNNRIAINANKADQLNVGRNISLTGDASGNATFNGSTDISINTTISQIYRQLTISTASSIETLKLNNNGGSGATGIVMQSSSQPYGVLNFAKPDVEKELPTIKIYNADYTQNAIVLHSKNLSDYIQIDAFTNEEIDTICGSVILNAAEEVW